MKYVILIALTCAYLSSTQTMHNNNSSDSYQTIGGSTDDLFAALPTDPQESYKDVLETDAKGFLSKTQIYKLGDSETSEPEFNKILTVWADHIRESLTDNNPHNLDIDAYIEEFMTKQKAQRYAKCHQQVLS